MPPGQQLVDLASEIVKACENQGDVGPLGVKSMRLAMEVWQAESRLSQSAMKQSQTDEASSVLSKTLEHVQKCSAARGKLERECTECHGQLDHAVRLIQAISPKRDDPSEEEEREEEDGNLRTSSQAGPTQITDAHETWMPVPTQDTRKISIKQDPLVDQLISILNNPRKRQTLQNLRGDFAQQAIDSLHWLLAQPSLLTPQLRESALLTLRKLCEASMLNPRLRILQSAEDLEIASDNITGDTYKGRYNNLEVSLRVIRLRGRVQKDMALKLYAREAVLWWRLQHPNIVPFFGVFDLDQEPNAICRVTPWMRNGNVVTYLKRNPKVPRTLLVWDIVSGLEYLHGMNIVHGDLKGPNILVKDSGEACITDFGLSSTNMNDALGLITAMGDLTLDYSSRRTTPWIAPELLEDDGRPSRASDVWAFACVCYEVISNRMPFQGQSDVQILRKLSQGISPAQRDSTTPPMDKVDEMWELMTRCWRQEPSERPTSQQILKEFEGYGFVRRVDDEEKDRVVSESVVRKNSIVVFDRTKVQDLLNQIDAEGDFSSHATNPLEPTFRGFEGTVQENSAAPEDSEQGSAHLEGQGRREMLAELKQKAEFNADPVLETLSPNYLQTIPTDSLDELSAVLSSQGKRKALQELKGDRAQLLIDFLYLILLQPPVNSATPWLQKHVLLTLCKLCGASLLYPRWYVLKSITYRTSECSGGFCDIRRGRCNALDLCLKVVRVTQSDQIDKMLKIYAREAILWGQLHHPNIVPFYGIFYLDEAQKRVCLVSPWMENGNIVAYLERNPTAPRKPFIRDIADGLEYLHDKNIIHADLKGLNILVNDSGNACITDFGLSVIWTDRTLGFTYTAGGAQGHSHRWAAPELVLAEDDARPSRASDMWAFGCVCYEVITRKLPFHKYSRDYQILSQLMKGRLPAQPDEELPLCPLDRVDDEMWNLMNSCWSTEPEKRPTCQEILSALGFDGLVEGTVPEDDSLAKECQYIRSILGRNSDVSIDISEARQILADVSSL